MGVMKCRHCSNDLPNECGFSHVSSRTGKMIRGKIACCMDGCISFGLNPRSKQFRLLVMGTSEEMLIERDHQKAAKMRETVSRTGSLRGDRNPNSRASMLARGLSDVEVKEKLSRKSKQGAQTKRDNGYYEDAANNPFSYAYWNARGLSPAESTDKVRSRIRNTPAFWLSRGYSEDEALLLARKSADTNSLHAKKQKWGFDGEVKYYETCDKISKSWSPLSSRSQKFGSSKQANAFFNELITFCESIGISRDDIQTHSDGVEYFIRHDKSIFFYDFVIHSERIIIEFNGEHVHPNIDMMTQAEIDDWRHAFSKKTAHQVLEDTRNKFTAAINEKFKILEVWSKDTMALDKAKNFIRKIHEH